MATKLKLVLFEDTPETQSEMLSALQKQLKGDGDVIPFDASQFKESEEEKTRMYESRLQNILKNSPYAGTTLIVADRDLSKSVKAGFAGLSVSAVAAAAKKLAIPICSYSRQPEAADYDWRGRWEEGHIVLLFSEGEEEVARRATVAARGFSQIAALLPEVIAVKTNNSAVKILGTLLGKPEYSEKIALYGVGDQNRLSEILAQAKKSDELEQRMTHFLGYWLWDSLLRYPGLLVNEVAASSYLNISETDFREPSVQGVFQDALYRGPFEDSKKPQWWRGALDDIVAKENCADGLELAQKKTNRKIARSQCCVEPSIPASYYCIISRKPVSLKNSKGGMSWFPRGADLTRISNPKFEEYGPWLGA
jgi:hypothetical protein